MAETYFKIGYISKTHGLKGEVTFVPGPECPDLGSLSNLFVEWKGSPVPYFIESVSIRADKAFLKLEDVNTPEQANALKGASVFLEKKARPKLARGEFYNDEVIGFRVVTENEATLGIVEAVEETGPNRFLVLTYQEKEVLIPVNGPFIRSVNKSRKLITVELPDGFLDI